MFPKFIQGLLNKYLNAEYFKYANSTTWDVVTSLIKDSSSSKGKRLRAILCGQFGDYGLKPQDSSFLIQAGIVAHYMGGAYYPVGGSQRISKAIVPTIEAAGGRVLVSCRAKSILVEGGRATGLEVVTVDKYVRGRTNSLTHTLTLSLSLSLSRSLARSLSALAAGPGRTRGTSSPSARSWA
jgi:phytoene dehydrogenase-like protein